MNFHVYTFPSSIIKWLYSGFHIFSHCLLLACLFSMMPAAANEEQPTINSNEIIKALQQGGYILYIRHAATDHSQQDIDLSDLSLCDLQRNLSQQGKDESRMLGEALNKLKINVDDIFTSPYCRCVDTAKIAFGRYHIVNDLRATFATNEAESTRLVGVLKELLSKPPKQGFNTVIIGHTANLRELTQVWPKPEGVTHVFKPLGVKGFKHIGRITPTEWRPLAGIE